MVKDGRQQGWAPGSPESPAYFRNRNRKKWSFSTRTAREFPDSTARIFRISGSGWTGEPGAHPWSPIILQNQKYIYQTFIYIVGYGIR